MAGRGPQTFKKKQKEQQRKEKQQEKLAKRLERKRNRQDGTGDDSLDSEQQPLIEGEGDELNPLDNADDDRRTELAVPMD